MVLSAYKIQINHYYLSMKYSFFRVPVLVGVGIFIRVSQMLCTRTHQVRVCVHRLRFRISQNYYYKNVKRIIITTKYKILSEQTKWNIYMETDKSIITVCNRIQKYVLMRERERERDRATKVEL